MSIKMPSQLFAIHTGAVSINLSTRRPILSIRPKSGWTGTCEPNKIEVMCGSGAALVEIFTGPTSLTSASWQPVDANSGVEYDKSATAFTGGTLVGFTYVSGAGATSYVTVREFFSDLLNRVLFLKVPLTIVVTPFTGNVLTSAGVSWTEA